MNVFISLLLVSSVIFGALFLFMIWSIRSGQLDDLDSPAEKALWNDVPEKRDPS